MLVRHFGHGVGHMRYERHQEIGPELIPEGDNNHADDDLSETKEQEDEMNGKTRDAEESEPEGDPMSDQGDSSDGKSEIDLEDSDSGSDRTSGSNDGGYTSL